MGHPSRHGPPPPEHVSLKSAPQPVMLGSFGGRPIVEVRLNGAGPYRFVLDTGSTGLVLTERLAEKIALADLGHARLQRPGASESAEGVIRRVEKLEVGSAELDGVFAVSTDLGAVLSGPEAPDGILGVACFQGLSVIIDLPRRKLSFSSEPLPPQRSPGSFEWPAGEEIPTVPVSVAALELRAHLDTGASTLFSVPRALAPRLPLYAPPTASSDLRTIEGATRGEIARIRGKVSIGPFELLEPEVRLVQSDAEVANLGTAWLAGFVITVDPAHHRVRLAAAK